MKNSKFMKIIACTLLVGTMIAVSPLAPISSFSSVNSNTQISASADTGKTKYYNAFTTKVINVVTNKSGSPYIKFRCLGETPNNAPFLSLKIYNHKTKTTTWKWVSGSGTDISSKLKLDKGTKFTITVSYLYDKKENWEKILSAGTGYKYGWVRGNWRISSTSALNYTIQ